MLSHWNEIETKVDSLIRRLSKLQNERARLEAENRGLRERAAQSSKDRKDLWARLDRVLAGLEALEAQIRG